MSWFALTGVIILSTTFLIPLGQNVLLSILGAFTLWLTGAIGTAAIGYESVRNLKRFGLRGIGRPRFHFELGRLIIAVSFIIAILVVSIPHLLPKLPLPINGFAAVRSLLGSLTILFALCTSCGLLLAFLSRNRGRGRAYECVIWFYCIMGGLTAFAFGFIDMTDDPENIQQSLSNILAMLIGIALMCGGILSELTRNRQSSP